MNKILLVAIAIIFFVACTVETEQAANEKETKAAETQSKAAQKQHKSAWKKPEKSTATPLTFDDLEKSREKRLKQAENARREISEDFRKSKEGDN